MNGRPSHHPPDEVPLTAELATSHITVSNRADGIYVSAWNLSGRFIYLLTGSWINLKTTVIIRAPQNIEYVVVPLENTYCAFERISPWRKKRYKKENKIKIIPQECLTIPAAL